MRPVVAGSVSGLVLCGGRCRYGGLVRDLAARRAQEQQAQLATAAERAASASAALRQVLPGGSGSAKPLSCRRRLSRPAPALRTPDG